MKYKYTRKEIVKDLLWVFSEIGYPKTGKAVKRALLATLSPEEESQVIMVNIGPQAKPFVPKSYDKQDKPVWIRCEKCGEHINFTVKSPPTQTTKHLDTLVVPEKIDIKIKEQTETTILCNQWELAHKFNSLIDFNKQLLISLKEIQK